MALVGKLEDLGLAELFHLLSLFRKSGELTLRSGALTGVFQFENGKIVHAADGAPRESLGNILVARGLIDRPTLETSLQVQRRLPIWKRLGCVLVEMNAVAPEVVEGIIREQLQQVTERFLNLSTGFFTFKPGRTGERTPRAVDTDLELVGGVNTDEFILNILTKLDEVAWDEGRARVSSEQAEELALSAAAAGAEPDQDIRRLVDYMLDPSAHDLGPVLEHYDSAMSEELADLRSLMVEIQLRTPSFAGEITLMILRHATRVVNRGVLCHLGPDGIRGIGQFGIDSCLPEKTSADDRVRRMLVPGHEPSVFFEVIETMSSYRGPLKRCPWNQYLVDRLGGQWPPEVVAMPIMVDGMIVGIFYGDNLPDRLPIGSTEGLDLLMIEAGLAIENSFLQEKLRRVQAQVRLLSQRTDK